MEPRFETLRAALDEKARESAREARRAAADRAARASLRNRLSVIWILPALGVSIGLVALAVGHTPNLLAPLGMLLAMLLAPLLRIAWSAARAWSAPVDRVLALRTFDEQVGARGRLVAAYDFLDQAQLGPFELATLEDARAALQAHAGARLALETPGPLLDERHARHFVAAALLLLMHTLLFYHFDRTAQPPGPTDIAQVEPPNPTAPQAPGTATTPGDDTGDQARDEDRPAPTAPPIEAEPKPNNPSTKLPDSMLPSAGESGQGKSSDAQTQSSPSESRGAPSGQTPAPPKESAAQLDTKKEPNKKPKSDQAQREPKPEEEQGGASAGRGTAKGSNRNTTTSKWTGKDQVTSPDEQEIEEDEDTEDESEEQKNRGGMQPNLRDRRPPASRDLRIGFGNQPNPDANGRGGPSEAKKSRGTASLVLGVPIPDRVKGQPNPGPTRITQERIEPTAEQSPDRPVSARTARTTDLGPLARPKPPAPTTQLTPWQRQLIRRYLDDRRQPLP